ncbi:MAG TPA: RteC domain-containing protein, partial [Mucilaginibacter sp.]|nr:RteC domain-containing protein [Mucilaginibacter sp.]
NEQEEIVFFKNWKPLFIAEQYYALEKFTIEANRPLTDSQSLKSYYEQELAFINRFFTQQQFLYQYYKFEFTELDQVLFVRGNEASNIVLPETPDLDPQFSTKGDHLFAKFIAYEKLRAYLVDELKSLQNPVRTHSDPGINSAEVKWTGETINLAEIGYGVWLTGQVNNGNATITEILECLERCFRIKIGTAFRRWQSISRRKRIKPTKYLDEMKNAVLKRLDEENER